MRRIHSWCATEIGENRLKLPRGTALLGCYLIKGSLMISGLTDVGQPEVERIVFVTTSGVIDERYATGRFIDSIWNDMTMEIVHVFDCGEVVQ